MSDTRHAVKTANHTPLLRRSWIAAWWEARTAVRTNQPLESYLTYRASQYLSRLAARRLRLPLEVSLEGNALRLREVETSNRKRGTTEPRSADEEARSLESELARRHGPDALVELAAGQARRARLDAQIEDKRLEVERRRDELAEALSSGRAAPAGEQAGSAHLRPVVPSLVPLIVAFTAVAILVLAEAWQLTLPFLNASGIDGSDLGPEFLRAPVQVLLGAAFALGATALLVGLSHVALARGRRALDGETTGWKRRVDGGVATTLGLLTLVVAWQLGVQRHASSVAGLALVSAAGGGAASGEAAGTLPLPIFVLLTGLLPFLSAAVIDWGRVRVARRADGIRAALAFDTEVRAREALRERLEESLRLAQQAHFDLGVDRAGADGAVKRLGWMGEQAQREAANEEWLEGEALARAREELRAVLEADRYAYLKAAGATRGRNPSGPGGRTVLFSPELGLVPPHADRKAA